MFSLFINDLIKYLELKRNRGISVSTEISDLLASMFADDISIFFTYSYRSITFDK